MAHGIARRTGGPLQAGTKAAWTERQLAVWLVEAGMRSAGINALRINDAIGMPSLFPFAMEQPEMFDYEAKGRLKGYRQGLDDDMVMLMA